MNLLWAILLAIGGIALVLFFSEQLVKGVVGTSINFKVSAFLISVIFLGFDPENLGVGAVGSYEQLEGIAAGSIIGSAMVAMALALGVTALLSPLSFGKISKQILVIPFMAVALFAVLVLDQTLSRRDGLILLMTYALAVLYLIYLNKKGISIQAGGEVKEVLEKKELPGKWKSAGLMLLSLAAIVGGSEMLVSGSKVILEKFHLSDTVYGMTILAFVVSVEEIARELPAALKGKPEISMGNVVGSVLAFFLFNAGLVALISPFEISEQTLTFFLPMSGGTVLFILFLLMVIHKIPRWAGMVLLALYAAFVIIGYFLS
jgi:cation:H+ antiporter